MRPGPSTRIALACLGIVLCGVPGAASNPPASRTGVMPARPATGQAVSIWDLLLPKAGAGEATAEERAARIALLGPGTADTVVGILTGEVVEPDVDYPVEARVIEMRSEILAHTLRRLPRAEVLAALMKRAAPGASVDACILVVRWLSELGGGDALQRVLSVAASLEPIQHGRAYVQDPLEEALSRFIAEDLGHVRTIGKALDGKPLELAPLLARVTAGSRSPAAASILMRNLKRSPDLDLAIVRGLAVCGLAGDGETQAAGLEFLRRALASSAWDLRRGAIHALAELGDAESAESFVALLGHDDPLTASAAREGLEKISGRHLGADQRVWEEWLHAESDWFESRLDGLVLSLSADDAAGTATALAEIQEHPLYRHAVAEAWRPHLTASQPARRSLFAGLFGSLGSMHALPWLVRALADEDATVRSAAHASLLQLTRWNLPPDSPLWRAWIED